MEVRLYSVGTSKAAVGFIGICFLHSFHIFIVIFVHVFDANLKCPTVHCAINGVLLLGILFTSVVIVIFKCPPRPSTSSSSYSSSSFLPTWNALPCIVRLRHILLLLLLMLFILVLTVILKCPTAHRTLQVLRLPPSRHHLHPYLLLLTSSSSGFLSFSPSHSLDALSLVEDKRSYTFLLLS